MRKDEVDQVVNYLDGNILMNEHGLYLGYLRIIAKIGIPSDKYQKDWKSRLRREKKV